MVKLDYNWLIIDDVWLSVVECRVVEWGTIYWVVELDSNWIEWTIDVLEAEVWVLEFVLV